MNAPKMPNPTDTANKQQDYNVGAATAQQNLNMIDQSNPYGSTSYQQIGTNADGTPKYSQTTSLDPRFSGVADNAAAAVSQPLDLSNDAIEGRLMELSSARVNPQLQQRRASTEQDLFNRGVRPGTEAYQRAMEQVTQGENDQWNQLALTGRNQAISEILTGRNQPLSELQQVTGGTQTNAATPQAGVSPVDYSGLIGQKYAADTQQYDDTMGALGSIAKTAGGWAFSDERLKEDIHKVGETSEGIPVKEFRYKGSPMMQLGVMAQEAQKKRPDAVKRGPGGFMMVNYDRLRA